MDMKMNKVSFFLVRMYFIVHCLSTLGQTSSNSAIISGDCNPNDFIAFYTFKGAYNMWENEKDRYFFNRNLKSNHLDDIVININEPTIIYLYSKRLSQQCPIYLSKGDSIKVISKSEESDFMFKGHNENDLNFFKSFHAAGYPTMGESWKFDSTNSVEYVRHITRKRQQFFEYLEESKARFNLSDSFCLHNKRDGECIFIWSAIENYQSKWRNSFNQEFITFVKGYESFFVNSNYQRSWSYYMALHTWNKFLAKYYYKIGDASEDQFKVAQKLNSDLRDDLLFLILTTNEKWTSVEDFNKCDSIYRANCKNKVLLTHYILKTTNMKSVINKNVFSTPSLCSVSGKFISWNTLIKKNTGKIILVDLWASWCAPCRTEINLLKTIYADSPEKFRDVKVINISVDENKYMWKKSISTIKTNNNFYEHFVIDLKSPLAKALLPDNRVPRYIIIDKKGNIRSMNAPKPSSIAFWSIINLLSRT